jgi:hypothetical protein
MTRADWLLLVVTAEIERRRDQINGDATVAEVLLAVEFPRGNGTVGSVRFKSEGRRCPAGPPLPEALSTG